MKSQAVARSVVAVLTVAAAMTVTSCASKPKRTTPKLSELEGRKVALVEVEAETTQRQMIEVALVNQLVRDGSFELISKQAIDEARRAPEISPDDWKALAKKAGAEVALRARVVEMEAKDHKGWTRIEKEDSLLAAEQGESARKSKQLVRAQSLEGRVQIELAFTDLITSENPDTETRKAIAEATETVSSDQSQGPIQLPAKMRFLEKLVNRAFADFFEKYRD